MNSYNLKHMIIDNGFEGEEAVTANFTMNNQDYSVTFKKADLEILNAWHFQGEITVPAVLPENIIEDIREDVKKRM